MYSKPEMVKFDKALSVVQGVGKGTFPLMECIRCHRYETIGAYEADE